MHVVKITVSLGKRRVRYPHRQLTLDCFPVTFLRPESNGSQRRREWSVGCMDVIVGLCILRQLIKVGKSGATCLRLVIPAQSGISGRHFLIPDCVGMTPMPRALHIRQRAPCPATVCVVSITSVLRDCAYHSMALSGGLC